MNIINFIKTNTSGKISNEKSIVSCLMKATIIIFEEDKCIIADDDIVYYIVIKKNAKDIMSFLDKNKKYLYDKISFTYQKRILNTFGKELLLTEKDGLMKFRTINA